MTPVNTCLDINRGPNHISGMDTKPRGPNAAPRLQIVAPRDWTDRLDRFIDQQPGMAKPSRSEVIRRAVDAWLDDQEKPKRKRLA